MILFSIFLQGINKIFLEDYSHGINVLDENDPQSLAEAVVVLIRPEVPDSLTCSLVSHVQTGPRDVTCHEVPNICKIKS